MNKPSNVSIRDQIKRLVDLQVLDVDIYSLRRDLKEKPDLISELKAKFESKKENLKKLEEKQKSFLLERKTKEGDLQAKEGEIAKANGQLNLLKTNKEYQAKLLEIENFKADKSVIEEKILIIFDEIDAANSALEKEKRILADEEKNFLTKKTEIDNDIKQLQERIATLQNQRNQITPEVNPAFLSRYERILENKQGLALVPVKNHACGGCYINLPEQTINEIRMHDKFVFCESCARILYLEDNL